MTELAGEPQGHCWSKDEENFNYDTLGKLMGDYEQLTIGSVVFFGTAARPDPADWVDANDIIEQLACRAQDECGESAEDYPEVSQEAKAKLDSYLVDWVRQHCPVSFYTVNNVQEYTITEEDVAR